MTEEEHKLILDKIEEVHSDIKEIIVDIQDIQDQTIEVCERIKARLDRMIENGNGD